MIEKLREYCIECASPEEKKDMVNLFLQLGEPVGKYTSLGNEFINFPFLYYTDYGVWSGHRENQLGRYKIKASTILTKVKSL